MCALEWGLLILLTLSAAVYAQQVQEQASTTRLVNVPPLIIDQPAKEIAFKEGETVELPCAASGLPDPLYKWQMNQKDFDPSGNDGRIAIRPGVGTLIFARPIPRDEGIYQCFAENKVGVALTIMVNLRLAILEPFNIEPINRHSPQLGMPLTLRCIPPRSFPQPDIFWTYTMPGQGPTSVDLTDRVTLDPSGNLHFANILLEDKRDSATYTCFVKNMVMRRIQQGAMANINPQGQTVQKNPPSILWQSPKTQKPLRGEVLRMKCIFSGSPTPRVDWVRTGKPMPSRARTDSFGQELVIEDVQFEDMGSYECQGINTEIRTPTRFSFTVDVEAAPRWIEMPMSIDAAEFDDTTFTCNGDGLPKPDFYWFQNGIPLSLGNNDDRRSSTEKTLTFRNMTQADAQVVQCNVTNKHGYIWANAYLNVLVEPPIIRDPPKQGQLAAEGQTVNLTCEVFGSPKPQVVWKKGNEQLTGGKFTIHKNGHLEISDVSLVDAGTYTCTANNRLGEASATGSLVVRRKTLIETEPLDVMVYEGTEAKFTCTATTDPEEVSNLEIKWKKDGQLIDYALAQRVFQNNMDNSLTISGTISLDTGKYSCLATNGLDEDEALAQLIVQGVPDPPRNVEVLCTNRARKAELTWQPGRENYAPILNFIVQYNTTFNPDTWIDIETNISQNERRKEVVLSPYSNYTFRVLARNKIGMSPPSQHTRTVCTTEPGAPEKNPENVIGEGDLPNNLVIFWTPMPKIEQNGQGFKYIVSWKRMDISNARRQSFSVDRADDWHYVIPEKFDKPYIPFEISVKASNGVGEASHPAETIDGHSGEDEPETSPRDVIIDEDSVRSSQVTLLWSQVDTSPEVINGFFRGYRVQFGKAADWPENVREQDFIFNDTNIYPRPRIKRALGDSVRAALRHLPPFTTIKAQVRVLNRYYAGPPSEPITFTTKEGEPGPPISLDVIARGSTHFELKWDPPAEENGIIGGYNISYQTITGLNLGRLQYRVPIEGKDVSRGRLTGLQPDTHYRVYLSAATRAGKGEPIFIDMKTAPSGPPSPPTFVVDGLNDTWVQLSWVPSRGPNPGSVFYVEYRPRGEFDWLKSPDEVLDFYTSVGDLNPGTTYQIRVVSKNGAGEEAPSEWLEFHTSGVGPGQYDLKLSGWFYGTLASIFLIIILLVLFMVVKKSRDEWWLKKEADIQDQVRTLQAQDAAMQLGVFNQYADTGSREMFPPDTSYGQPYDHDKEDDFYETEEYKDQPTQNPDAPYNDYPPMTEKPPYPDYPQSGYPQSGYPPQDPSYPQDMSYPPPGEYPSPEAPYPTGVGYPQYGGNQPPEQFMNIQGDQHNQSKDSFV